MDILQHISLPVAVRALASSNFYDDGMKKLKVMPFHNCNEEEFVDLLTDREATNSTNNSSLQHILVKSKSATLSAVTIDENVQPYLKTSASLQQELPHVFHLNNGVTSTLGTFGCSLRVNHPSRRDTRSSCDSPGVDEMEWPSQHHQEDSHFRIIQSTSTSSSANAAAPAINISGWGRDKPQPPCLVNSPTNRIKRRCVFRSSGRLTESLHDDAIHTNTSFSSSSSEKLGHHGYSCTRQLNSSGEEYTCSSADCSEPDDSSLIPLSSAITQLVDQRDEDPHTVISPQPNSERQEYHNEKERVRRKRISIACEALKSCVPGVSGKTDRATVFEMVVQYVQLLQSKVGNKYDSEFLDICM
ncbi:PREDICTED: uncharacterized protein LOC106816991 [Priapulus caudatus]|uniref:Uncharacterized protein LOC106816991 n=1 Tax=Priapulus caudatus TaxID=37621 RepID=A0ABM1EY51_PRICU|nr:PREDICTED: uncharacterized protein LOC106816991 [Priapulus caudatus]